MTLTDFTTCDQIRAILSVTEEELEDQVLLLPLYADQLVESIYELSTDLLDSYKTIAALDLDTHTAKQDRFYRLTRVFAAYSVANQLLDSLPLLAVKKEQDARAQVERFETPFQRVEQAVRSALATASSRLVRAFNDLGGAQMNPRSLTRTLTGSAGLPKDPVTNV